MKYTEQIIASNKRKIGKWVLEDQKKIKQLEDDLASFSFKICNRIVHGESTRLSFAQVYYTVTKKQAKIYAMKQKYEFYRPTSDQN